VTVARSFVGAIALATLLFGCSEFQARQHARRGNAHFREGNYAKAAEEYEIAAQLHPGLPVVALNLGLACRQLMLPGAQGADQERAVACALRAFQRFQQLTPNDPRGDQLYLQTLFDADRFDDLTRRYEQRLQEKSDDLAAINGLIQVNARAGRYKEELRWTARRADVRRADAAAQYAVGVFVWDILFRRGGNGEIASFDPRPDPDTEQAPTAPDWGEEDITGEERIQLAEQGIEYLERALAIREKHREAMVYLNLVLRQKALAYFDDPDQWLALMDEADEWRTKALSTKQETVEANGGAD
jgi:tetratricopeptide (TPR) repeat protein